MTGGRLRAGRRPLGGRRARSRGRFRRLLVATSLACAGALHIACASRPEPADILFRGGVVYTVDPARPRAEAVAVRDGLIAFVGSDADAAAYAGPETEVGRASCRERVFGYV